MFLSAGPATGHVIVDEPNGGEFLEVGSVFRIEWHIQIAHTLLNWDLWYSTTGAAGPWTTIEMDLPPGSPAVGSIHTFDWTVPDDPSDQVRVRVRMDNAATDYLDISNGNLTIGSPKVCNDVDNGGYGSPGDPSRPNGAAGDCDDGDPDINPGAAEVCDDFVDNDCDELTDGDDPDCEGPTTHHVVQVGLTFDPADIVIVPGDTVEWHWADGIHTVTSGTPCTPDGRFNDPLDVANQVVTYTVPSNEPGGVIPDFCIPHCLVDMTGTITVQGIEPPTLAPPPHDILKNRYISIDPRGASGDNPNAHHIRVTLDSTQVNGVDAGQVGTVWWANDPDAKCISILGPTQPASEPNWAGCPIVHLTGCSVIPTTTYSIATVSAAGDVSDTLVAETQLRPDADKWWGDSVGVFNGAFWSGPQGVCNFDDVNAALFTFKDSGAINATHVSVTDIHPNRPDLGGNSVHPNRLVSIDDVFQFIQAFQGAEYPGGNLAGCTDP